MQGILEIRCAAVAEIPKPLNRSRKNCISRKLNQSLTAICYHVSKIIIRIYRFIIDRVWQAKCAGPAIKIYLVRYKTTISAFTIRVIDDRQFCLVVVQVNFSIGAGLDTIKSGGSRNTYSR